MGPKRVRTLTAEALGEMERPMKSQKRCLTKEDAVVTTKNSRKRKLTEDQEEMLITKFRRVRTLSEKRVPINLEEVNVERDWELEDEESSTENEEEETEELRKRRERALLRIKQKLKTELLTFGELSYLEACSVTEKVWKDYRQRVVALLEWCEKQGLPMTTDAEVDEVIVKYMNVKFERGYHSHEGEKLLAGFACLFADFGPKGSRKLPRAHRALKGWRRKAPPRSRRPVPWMVVAAVACRLSRKRLYKMGAWVILSYGGYLRPKETMGLRRGDLIAPVIGVTNHWCLLICPEERRDRTKIGESDDSVVWDAEYLQWFNPVLEALKVGDQDELLWDFSYGEIAGEIKKVSEELQISVVPYQLRHAGPSWERLTKLRTLEQIQKRGRWKTMRSVTRYEKAARLTHQVQSLTSHQLHLCEACVDRVEEFVLGRADCP